MIPRKEMNDLPENYPAELLVRKRIHDANVSSNIELGHADLLGALRASARRKLKQSAPSP